MSQLALYVFGPPRLERDGVPVHIAYRKAIALLAYLAVTAQNHSRDSLTDLFWPDNGQSKARAELRRMLTVLNHSLGRGWLTTDQQTVFLDTDSASLSGQNFWLDVADFQGKLKICESHNHPPNVTCPECLPALEEAVTLYTDEFMAGFSLKDCRSFDEWQFFQAENLRAQLTNALMRLSSHSANALAYESAIGYAQRWLALDPLDEAAHWQLISLFSQSGQRAAAIRQYETCRQTLDDELGVEPSEEIRDLYQKIRASKLLFTAASRPKSNLPVQATPFIGRVDDVAEIRARLTQDDCRLLTLLGPGGSGKTRLAIEAASRLLNEFKHGVFFVNLAPLEDPERIPTSIASALSFSFFEEGTPKEELLDYLRNKEMLLILDNFEHLLDGVEFVYQIKSMASGVKILATSRARLMITGEQSYNVWGMAYPESPVSLKLASKGYSAIKLFESEAKRVQGDFQLTENNLPDVICICALLEGIPLGIVLAASWVELLAPGEIAAEITRNLEFLQIELVDVPQRQRSLRSVFNHSWRLLSDREQKIFSALSVFRGGFSRQAAQVVADASLNDLMWLARKSILHRTSTGRYEIHEMLRQFAVEKLEMDPFTEVHIRGKHSDYYCQELAVWECKLQGPQQGVSKKEMVLEIDNIRAAWDWAVQNARIEAILGALNGLCIFYNTNRQRLEAVAICQSLSEKLVVARDSHQNKKADLKIQFEILRLQARTLAWCGWFNSVLGNFDLARMLNQECLAVLESRELADQDIRFEKAFVTLSLAWDIQKPQVERRQLAQQAVNWLISLEQPWWLGNALRALALIMESTSPTKGMEIYREGLAVRRKLGDLRGIVDSLERMSWFAASRFQFDEAQVMLREALSISAELQDHLDFVAISGSLVIQRVWQGRFEEAHNLVRETMAAYHDLEYQQSFAALFHARAAFPDQYLGDYEVARRGAQRAIKFLEDTTHYSNVSHPAVEILGNVALGEGCYAEAQECFQACLHLVTHVPDKITRLLGCQGFADRGLKKDRQAKDCFFQALKGAVKLEHYFSLVHILPGLSLMFADQGKIERAVELYALACNYGVVANSKWFADIAGDEIAAMAEKLPIEVVETAKARGGELDLWETAEKLLVELEAIGWGVQANKSAISLQVYE